MELRRDARLGRRLAGLIGAALAVLLLWVLVRGSRGHLIAGHAWAVPSGPDAVQVEVLNGTGRQGLARVGARALRRHGIDVMLFANADSALDSTRIIVRRGDGSGAEAIRKALGTGRISTALDTLRRVDATVILGADFRGPVEVHP